MQAVTLYTTPFCPYCVSAKRLLGARNIAFSEVDVSDDDALRERLSRENGGYQTVPMIFIGSEFVGGYTELAALDRAQQLGPKVQA